VTVPLETLRVQLQLDSLASTTQEPPVEALTVTVPGEGVVPDTVTLEPETN
jgi:hypothetical protein